MIFRADRIEHEVLPAYRERLALTTWMYGALTDLFWTVSEIEWQEKH